VGQQKLSARFEAVRLAARLGSGDGPMPVAADPASRALLADAAAAAATAATVLLTGPSGVGKEVWARFVHAASPRAARPFLAVNCAALPEAMLESLLFGHVRGAFTGAHEDRAGLFRAADSGTLFLDELGDLPLALQAKLLRAIEMREVLPLGAERAVAVDVRIVAATHRDLGRWVAEGRFRADLRWRLSVFPLALPPLCDRPGDLLPLTARLLDRLGAGDQPIEEAALERLLAHPFPGNVRELSNLLERALILARGGPIGPAHLRFDDADAPIPLLLAPAARAGEAVQIRRALAFSGGRRGEAARALGISERTLRYKLAALEGRPRPRAGQPRCALQGAGA
jgi:two-component system response regulator FlrC